MTCISTPGEDIDVLVTQGGIAVNPKNTELRQRLADAGLPVIDIRELKEKAPLESVWTLTLKSVSISVAPRITTSRLSTTALRWVGLA